MKTTLKLTTYEAPQAEVLELTLQVSMLASATGTGSDLVSTGDYDGDDFDDLFN